MRSSGKYRFVIARQLVGGGSESAYVRPCAGLHERQCFPDHNGRLERRRENGHLPCGERSDLLLRVDRYGMELDTQPVHAGPRAGVLGWQCLSDHNRRLERRRENRHLPCGERSDLLLCVDRYGMDRDIQLIDSGPRTGLHQWQYFPGDYWRLEWGPKD